MLTPTGAIIVVIMNAAATAGVPVALLESMAKCEDGLPIAEVLYIAEWPAATLDCVPLTLAPDTSPRPMPRPTLAPEVSPRPKPRPVTADKVLRELRQMMWGLGGKEA